MGPMSILYAYGEPCWNNTMAVEFPYYCTLRVCRPATIHIRIRTVSKIQKKHLLCELLLIVDVDRQR